MAKKRPFQPTTFVQSKNTETGNPMPKFSKDILRRVAQNAEDIAVLACRNLVSTMGLSPSAIPILRGTISRMLKDNMRPRFEEISTEDAAHLFGGTFAQTSADLAREVAEKPGSTPHWFLTVGIDISGNVTFKVWPIAIVQPTCVCHPTIEEIRKFAEFSVLEKFAVLLSMRGLPLAGKKL